MKYSVDFKDNSNKLDDKLVRNLHHRLDVQIWKQLNNELFVKLSRQLYLYIYEIPTI